MWAGRVKCMHAPSWRARVNALQAVLVHTCCCLLHGLHAKQGQPGAFILRQRWRLIVTSRVQAKLLGDGICWSWGPPATVLPCATACLYSLQVELQGVSLVVLSVFRDADKARQLADLVQRHGGIMGAAVCCAESGGSPHDEWTTCDRDRDQLLDR